MGGWFDVPVVVVPSGARKVTFADGSNGGVAHQYTEDERRRRKENSRRYQERMKLRRREERRSQLKLRRELAQARSRNGERLVEKERQARVLGGVLSGASRRRG